MKTRDGGGDAQIVVVVESLFAHEAHETIVSELRRRNMWRRYSYDGVFPVVVDGDLDERVAAAVSEAGDGRAAAVRDSLRYFQPLRSQAEHVVVGLGAEEAGSPAQVRNVWEQLLATDGEYFLSATQAERSSLRDRLLVLAGALTGELHENTKFFDVSCPDENACDPSLFFERVAARPHQQWFMVVDR